MTVKQFANEVLEHIESLKGPAMEEAKAMFPHHPKAQDVWVKLNSMSGGIKQTVEVLGLKQEFDLYLKEFDVCLKNGLYESATIQLEDFREYCKEQVRENFYMFR